MAPKKLPVRPTTDFAKEGLFNILRNRLDLHAIAVLDLYAGTGNISFEFASRGTPDITAVDSHRGCIRYIEKIAGDLEFPIRAVRGDVLKYLESCNQKFDLIFADPPYDQPLETLQEIVASCWTNALLKPDGLLILEHSKHMDLSNTEHFTSSRRYGGSVFSFFEME